MGRMMRASLAWIQPHPHGAILRHFLYTVICSSNNYLENQLLPNNLMIVRDHGDDEENIRGIKDVLKNQGDVHTKMEIQSNSVL
jgi:hypothetical protein